MKNTYTLILGDAATDADSMTFTRVDSVRTYASQEAAEAAGEAALQAGTDSWCIPELYAGTLVFAPKPHELLRAAIAAGLTQQDALDAFAAPPDHPAVLAAQELGSDDVQVDARALISPADAGTWVQAWVWVPACETCEEA